MRAILSVVALWLLPLHDLLFWHARFLWSQRVNDWLLRRIAG